MLVAAIAALFVLIPRYKPQSRVVAGLVVVVAVLLTGSNIYLKSNTGHGLDDRVACAMYPSGQWCREMLGSQPPAAPEPSPGGTPPGGGNVSTGTGGGSVTRGSGGVQPKPSTPVATALQEGQTFRDCPECPEMVVVPAGSFTMGDDPNDPERDRDASPQHRVSIRSFAAGKFEVTFAEWDACVAAGGCGGHRPDDRGWGRGSRPVINVSWDDAKQYVGWLSRRTGKTYRLLAEAEWEYAARAGTTTAYPWGGQASNEYANYFGLEGRDEWDTQTAPVGQFPSNRFGLFDMHGNVWEWGEDCFNKSYNGAPSDGRGWTAGDCSLRVIRGGSWGSNPRLLRSATRLRNNPSLRSGVLGFRVARHI